MNRIRTTLTTVAVVLIGLLAVPADARPAPAGGTDEGRASGPGSGPDRDLVAAMQRDLGISKDQAEAQLAAVVPSALTEARLRARLGARFGGAWMNPGGTRLVVAITDAVDAAAVRAAGAEPTVVTRSERQLKAVHAALDRHARRTPKSKSVTSWYVDPKTNSVVIEALPAALAAGRAFMATSGVDPSAIRVVPAAGSPQPLAEFYEVRGGDAFYTSRGRCSVGFSVHRPPPATPADRGFVTAGHCLTVGTTVKGYNNKTMGTVAGSSFPGDDYGWVRTNDSWVTKGVVNNYSGGTVAVRGSVVAPIGSPVCRSGSTTGWRCGTIRNTGVTVEYSETEVVGGMTETTACADRGDSGGPFISDGQAQGVLSGGRGTCTNSGITYFQPVKEILTNYTLELITTSTPTTIHALSCEFFGPPQYWKPRYWCQVTYYGGAAPYTFRWSRDGNTPTTGGTSIGAPCPEGEHHTVWVEVTDAQGRQATAETEFGCPVF